ncbi:MAG: hypothetical protein JWN79_2099 [Gemmatimonadetes bacterium]|jgi:hypothetical protein|nr:hypothetical protein [Gemmatimonadota bacterium]
MELSRLAVPRVLRIAGIVDFVIACLCITSPRLHSSLGSLATYAFGAVLLAGSAIMFILARRTERQAAQMPVSPSPATG